MEYLQVFDKNKNILNEKVERKNKNNLPEGKYYMVILIFIENRDGKFLMQKTSKQKGACIAVTGGHVQYECTSLETVIKETQEEIGLKLIPQEINYVNTIIDGNCYIETYYTKKDIDINSLVIEKSEVEYVNWFSKEEIKTLIKNKGFREGNIKPFEQVLEYLK